jgi:hypothetical protein
VQSPQPDAFSKLSILGPLIGFVLGLASALILDRLKRRGEKHQLVEVFRAEFSRTGKELEYKTLGIPVPLPLARARGVLFGVDNVAVRGTPEYEFEVYNVKLFETEGVRLAQRLGRPAKEQFWELYGYLRDAESVRLALNRLAPADRNYEAYQRVFTGLTSKAYKMMTKLEGTLEKERSPLEKIQELLGAITRRN